MVWLKGHQDYRGLRIEIWGSDGPFSEVYVLHLPTEQKARFSPDIRALIKAIDDYLHQPQQP